MATVSGSASLDFESSALASRLTAPIFFAAASRVSTPATCLSTAASSAGDRCAYNASSSTTPAPTNLAASA